MDIKNDSLYSTFPKISSRDSRCFYEPFSSWKMQDIFQHSAGMWERLKRYLSIYLYLTWSFVEVGPFRTALLQKKPHSGSYFGQNWNCEYLTWLLFEVRNMHILTHYSKRYLWQYFPLKTFAVNFLNSHKKILKTQIVKTYSELQKQCGKNHCFDHQLLLICNHKEAKIKH